MRRFQTNPVWCEEPAARRVNWAPELVITGTAGDDVLHGTHGADRFDLSQGGNDRVRGGDGNDTFYFGATFDGHDQVNGLRGGDIVALFGDYSAGVELVPESLVRVDLVTLAGGSYVITGDMAGHRAEFQALGLTEDQSLYLNVNASGKFYALGGAGDDVLYAPPDARHTELGGRGGDDLLVGSSAYALLWGGPGADRIVMNGSANIAYYVPASDSTPESYDTIVNMEASGGSIGFAFDSNTEREGIQLNFHLGQTAEHFGDIVFAYDARVNETIVRVFTDSDTVEDFMLHLTGNVQLTIDDFTFGPI